MNVSRKNKKGRFFITGLLLGFLITVSLFLIVIYFFPEKLYTIMDKTFVDLYPTKTVTEDVVVKETQIIVYDTVKMYVKIDTNVRKTPSLPEQPVEQWNNEDVEFSIEPEKNEEMLMQNRILNTKKITVKIKENQEETPITPPISVFEVQQWSILIKNRISYQNSAGILKITGMNIDAVEIFFVKGNYYLYNGVHYYVIKENKSYENLIVTEPPF